LYKKIVVPLDGSKLAECTLDHVADVAVGCHVSEVILLRALEPVFEAGAYGPEGADVTVQLEAAQKADATAYLNKASDFLSRRGVKVSTSMVKGRAAEVILDVSQKEKADLVIMSTHGRTGVSLWTMGSVAERVLRTSTIPVLIVVPKGCRLPLVVPGVSSPAR
jgi:nucleotide-binding universal stress UspA family protein